MSWLREDGGSIAVSTVALLPLVLLTLAGAVDLGALRLEALRARSAADLAVVVAVNDQDDAELARTGRIRLAADAASVARAYFAANLETIRSALAVGSDEIAESADIASFSEVPTVDPLTGARYDAPTVRIAAAVPLRTPLLGALLGPRVTAISVRSAASAR